MLLGRREFINRGLAAAAMLGAGGCDGGAKPPANGQPAPAFRLSLLGGGSAAFPDDYSGRVLALRFWADWCPFCKKEMAEVETVFRRRRDEGLAVLAINVSQSPAAVEKFVRPLGVSYDIGLDEASEVARLYAVTALPVTLFIDRSGLLRSKILGESDAATFAAKVEELL
jgi:peroxiredoxin